MLTIATFSGGSIGKQSTGYAEDLDLILGR